MSRREDMEMEVNYKPLPLRNLAEDIWQRHDVDRDRRIPFAQMKERILHTEEADYLPNALIVMLLKKADENHDHYISYEEFMNIVELVEAYPKGRQLLKWAALAILPRSKRTLEKRKFLEEHSCCPLPFSMLLAAKTQLVIFIYYIFDMGSSKGRSGPSSVHSPLIYNPNRRYEAWRYISYALIHSGYAHLIINLLVQTLMGIMLEMVHRWRVGMIYFSGVLFGSLLTSVMQPKSYFEGSSGGIYALLYAHFGNLILNWSEMQYRWVQLVIIVLVSGCDFGFAIWKSFFSPTLSNTTYLVNLGGAIAGILVGICILPILDGKRWKKCQWWVAFVLFFLLAGTGVLLNVLLPVPEYFPYDDRSPLPEGWASFVLQWV